MAEKSWPPSQAPPPAKGVSNKVASAIAFEIHTRSHVGLDDGNLEIRTSLAQHVGGAQAAGARANDDNVTLRVLIQIMEVTAGHGAGDLALADRSKLEAVPLAGKLLQELGLVALAFDGSRGRGRLPLELRRGDGSSLVDSHWRRHCDDEIGRCSVPCQQTIKPIACSGEGEKA